jgi:hypothetical protein
LLGSSGILTSFLGRGIVRICQQIDGTLARFSSVRLHCASDSHRPPGDWDPLDR